MHIWLLPILQALQKCIRASHAEQTLPLATSGIVRETSQPNCLKRPKRGSLSCADSELKHKPNKPCPRVRRYQWNGDQLQPTGLVGRHARLIFVVGD